MSIDTTIPNPLMAPKVKRSEIENMPQLGVIVILAVLLLGAGVVGWGALNKESQASIDARAAAAATVMPVMPATITQFITVTEIVTEIVPALVDVFFPVTVTVAVPVTVTDIQSVYVPGDQVVVTVTEVVQIPAPLPVAPAGAVLVCIYGEGLTGIYLGPASPDVQPLGVTGGSCTPVVWGGPVGDYRLTFTR